MIAGVLRHGGTIGLLALLAGLAILVIDWLLVLDAPGERIRESVVSDIGGVALVLTGAAILLVLRFQRGDAGRFQREGVEAEATVDEIHLGFFGTDILLSFTDATGAQQRVKLRGSNLSLRPGFGPGTQITVRYDPDNPRSLRFQETLDTLAPRN